MITPAENKTLIKISTDKQFLDTLMPDFKLVIDTIRQNYKRLYLYEIPDIALIKAALSNYNINLQQIRPDGK